MLSGYNPRLAAIAAIALLTAVSTPAFDLTGASWSDGDIVMHLQLGPVSTPLVDGAPDWNTVAQSALEEWNAHLTRSRFTWEPDSTAQIRRGNRTNNVAFRPDVYGSAWGERTLAVSLGTTNTQTGRSTEADVLFNSNLNWNSYRGATRGGTRDLRRVALHEFGHVLGLDHPDEARPTQTVTAIMNSLVTSIDVLQADDIAGARTLYNANTGAAPSIAAHPQAGNLQVGDSYTLAVTANGSGPLTYTWAFQPTGSLDVEPFTLAEGPSYTIGSVQLHDAGRYMVAVSSPGAGFVLSESATLTVRPIPTSSDTALANISTRGVVGRDDNVMIAGLFIRGSTSKDIFVRAAGPALTGFGVSGVLGNPTLRIVSSSGEVVAQNDDWETADAAAIIAASDRLGAFPFQSGSKDAAILTKLPPGSYTAIVSGVNDTTGIALVEAYDADPDEATARTRKLVNIATRGQVNTGDDILIAGLAVRGPGPRTYLIRAVGPTLARDYGVSNALRDPFLQIYRGENLLRENDDWDMPGSAQQALRDAAKSVGAFALVETRDPATRSGLDAAMLITLQPGSYTAKVSGFEGVTGVALVEIYELP